MALRYSSVLALSNDLIHREQKIVLGLKSGLPVLEEERVKISIENNFRRFYALKSYDTVKQAKKNGKILIYY